MSGKKREKLAQQRNEQTQRIREKEIYAQDQLKMNDFFEYILS